MFKFTLLLLIVCSALLSNAEKIRYDNFQIHRLKIENEDQLNVLKVLEKTDKRYSFWESPVQVNMEVPILVPPTIVGDFSDFLKTNKFTSTLINANFQDLIDAEVATAPKELEWENYHTLDEIYTWLDQMVALHPEMTSEVIGTSYEGRPIRVIKISKKPGNPGIFIETHIHAREWITSATVTWIIMEMFRSTDPEVIEILENYDWYIVPVLNVDGFEYTHATDRQWRKTRSEQANGCIGVDANRNFGYNWMQGGADSDPCSNTFAGPEPYSEREVRSLIDYYVTVSEKIDLYLAIHSYGQYILIPYGTGIRAPNFDHMQQIGDVAASALAVAYGTPYTVGNTAEVLYVASGTSPDWAYGSAKTPLAFTYEFRDLGATNFVLPPEQIIPNSIEVLQSWIAMLRESKSLGYMPRRD